MILSKSICWSLSPTKVIESEINVGPRILESLTPQVQHSATFGAALPFINAIAHGALPAFNQVGIEAVTVLYCTGIEAVTVL